MRVRDIIGLVLALVLAIGVAFLTRLFLTKEEKPGQEVALKSEQITKILVAGKTLYPGDRIKTGDFIWQEWPKTSLIPDYMVENQSKAEDYIGALVRFPIHKGNPIIRTELILKGEKSILAAILAPGKRAISIDVTPSGSDSGLIFPGDYVDVVLATTATEGTQQVGKSKTILKRIKVLAFDTTLSAPETTPKSPPHVATLEVTPAQADVLMAGVKEGTISLSLHSLETGGPEPAADIPAPAVKSDKTIILMRGKEKSEIQFQEK